MTAAAEASALESRVGHYYQIDDTYQVGREKLREFARAVQDYHPAHWKLDAAAELGYPDLVAPLTFTSAPAMAANRHLFESVVIGYEMYLQTEEVSSSTGRSSPATNCTSTSNCQRCAGSPAET